MASRRRSKPHARAAALSLPRLSPAPLALRRLLPSPRSVLVGLALALLGAALYVAARETSVFALREVRVAGAGPEVSAQVRRTLRPFEGASLVVLDGRAVARRLRSLPVVASFEVDRSFPHTLSVVVVPERPVAVLRSGDRAWLVSGRARVIAPAGARSHPRLPRLWISRTVRVSPGATLPDVQARAARVLSLLHELPLRSVTATRPQLTVVLRSGRELRLGLPGGLRLKLAVARRVLPLLTPERLYLDVSVPGRPVAGTTLKSEVEVEPSPSTSP